MNDALRKRCRALIDAIATPLIAELLSKVESDVRARFEAALTTPIVQHDLKPAKSRSATRRPSKRRSQIAPERSTAAPPVSPRKVARAQETRKQVAPVQREAAPAPKTIPAREAAAIDTSVTTQGKPRQRAIMRCGNCGEVGFRREGCGKTHNVAGSPMSDAIAKSNPPTPTPTPAQQAVLDRARARNGVPAR